MHRKEIPSQEFINAANSLIHDRIDDHLAAIETLKNKGSELKHKNLHYGFPVMTKQETDIVFDKIVAIQPNNRINDFEVSYCKLELASNERKPKSAFRQRMPRKLTI